MYGATIGKTGILGIDAATNQAICAILPFNNIFIPKFGLYWLQSQRQNLIKQGFGGAQPNINQGVIYNLSFPLSPLPEQHRIVSAIEERFTILDAVTTALQQNKQKLKLARASVLKHAVEGKLTEKWRAEHPATESGSELLERILAERRAKWEAEQLAKGKDPRKLRYEEPNGPDMSELQDLPEGWEWTTLEQVTGAVRPICYGILMPKENIPDGIPYVKVKDMKGDKIDIAALHRTAPEIAAMYSRASLKPGDLLLAIRGTYGRIAEVPVELEGANITQDTARLDVTKQMDRHFIATHLRSSISQKYFQKVSRGVAVKGVNIADVKLTPITLPPFAEQQQIVAEVERRLSVIEQAEVAIETSLKRIERARQSILERAFSGRLVPQDPNDEPASVLLERIQEERGKRVAEGKQRGKNGGVKAVRGKKTKEQEFVPQWQLLRDAKESGSIDESLGHVGAHEDGALGRGEVGQGEMGKEELEDLVQMPLLLWD